MQHLEQKLLLQQKLSPQQILFSTLLQLPVLALEQRLKAELELNPLLEEDLELETTEETDQEEERDSEEERDDFEEPDSAEEKDDELDEVDWDEILNDEDNYGYNPEKDEEEVSMPDPAPVTLTEHLLSQFHMLPLSPEEIEIGEYLIWNIDDDGYITEPMETIVEQLQKPQEKIEHVLSLIRRLDPVGIGSRNLQECLLVQLEESSGERNQDAILLIQEHFDDFKNKRFEKIARAMGKSLDEVKAVIERISRLNPKPGEGYIIPAQNYVIPDVIIEKVGNEFIVSLNDWNVPRLRINNAYRRMLTDSRSVPESTKKYIKQKIEAARWVINSIQQRKDTILRVTRAIVGRQLEFFEHGPGHIKPMILKDIADEISMDISTISRVTNGKYAQTDYGVFELKYFFSEKMTTATGDQVSTLNIKDKIKSIIDGEDPKRPLTDDKIVKILSGQGIPIARRTVAKYREQMRIPVARMRREI